MGIISVNSDGKKLFGDGNVVNFKTICATYKVHYKIYRGETVYEDETVDIEDGKNSISVTSFSESQGRFLEVEFFDANGDKFLPYNVEFQHNLAKTVGGNGIYTTLSDGTIRMVVQDSVVSGATTKYISFAWGTENEDIDSRKVAVHFSW